MLLLADRARGFLNRCERVRLAPGAPTPCKSTGCGRWLVTPGRDGFDSRARRHRSEAEVAGRIPNPLSMRFNSARTCGDVCRDRALLCKQVHQGSTPCISTMPTCAGARQPLVWIAFEFDSRRGLHASEV